MFFLTFFLEQFESLCRALPGQETMVADITSYYLSLDDSVRLPKSKFTAAINQIKGGVLNDAFSSKGLRLEDDNYKSKLIVYFYFYSQ